MNNTMTVVMLDIDMRGKKVVCPILSGATLMFEPAIGRVGKTCHQRIAYQAALKPGEPEEQTLQGWQKQSDPARFMAFGGNARPDVATRALRTFIAAHCAKPRVPWGYCSPRPSAVEECLRLDNTLMRLAFEVMLMKNLIKVVHTGKSELGWDEETYRDVLLRETGKQSAKDCTAAELARVIRHMRRQGFTTLPRHGRKPHVAAGRQGMLSKTEALLASARAALGLPRWHDYTYAGRKKTRRMAR